MIHMPRRFAILCVFAIFTTGACAPRSGTSAPPAVKLAFVTNNSSEFWKIAAAGVRKYEAEGHVQVDVKDNLAAFAIDVHGDAVARHCVVHRDAFGRQHELADQRRVPCFEVVERRNVNLGNHEHVQRGQIGRAHV
mgnify:CR=1 FL=1